MKRNEKEEKKKQKQKDKEPARRSRINRNCIRTPKSKENEKLEKLCPHVTLSTYLSFFHS